MGDAHPTWLNKEYARREFKYIKFSEPLFPDNLLKGTSLEFERVLRNLLDNAIRYSASGKNDILINLEKQENFLAIKITNHGFIDKNKLGNIFTPYQKSTDKKGLHIGLAASKKLVDHIGGELKINNNETNDRVIASLN